MTSPAGSPSLPALSVIIPVYNGGPGFERCLRSLQASAWRDYELIVVDDASTDGSAALAVAYHATLYRLAGRGGPARARNHGAELARAPILVFLDADVCVHADTLQRIVAYFSTYPDCVAVMGSYDDTPADPHFVSQWKNLFHHFVHHHSARRASTFWAGCGAIRRQAFLAAGGFDATFTRPCIEDIELGARLFDAGARLDLEPAIQVKHLKRWTLVSLVRTDVCDRALPWLQLMLRQGEMRADLNVTLRHRASVGLVAGLLGMLLLGALGVATGVAAVSAASVLVVLNLDLYRFFLQRRGPWFAVRAVPLHWFYYFYCGLAVLIAMGLHCVRRTRRRLSPALSDRG